MLFKLVISKHNNEIKKTEKNDTSLASLTWQSPGGIQKGLGLQAK